MLGNIWVSRDTNLCKTIMCTAKQMLSFKYDHQCTCLPAVSHQPVSSCDVHTRSWLLMSKPFLQQHFQDSNFTTRISLVPAPFKQTCPEIQVSRDHGDSPRARCKVEGRWHLYLHRWGPGFGTTQCTSTYLNCILSPLLAADKTVRYWTSCSVWVYAERRNAVVWSCQTLAPLRVVEGAVCPAAIWM